MSRRIVVVTIGVLGLLVAYLLGARSAQGQASPIVDGAHIDCDRGPNGSMLVTGVVGRTFYWSGQAVAPPVPGSSRVVATCGGYGFYVVVLENGDVYRGTDTHWTYDGNLRGSASPTLRETWGSLKTKYR